MLITKQMMKDIAKNSDLFVCDFCGSQDIDEKVWVDLNDQLSLGGKWYALVLDGADDRFWCRKCNEECNPITFEEYTEGKNEDKV